jgi:hypothetical protein
MTRVGCRKEWAPKTSGCAGERGRHGRRLAVGIYQIVGTVDAGAEYARFANERRNVLIPERWELCDLSLARIGPSDAVMETTIQERNYDSKNHSVQAVAGYSSCGWMWIRLLGPPALL